MEKFKSSQYFKKIIAVILLLLIALFSVSVLTKTSTNPERYEQIVKSIDEKKATVTTITIAADTAAIALAAIPGDSTTPLADKIMDISSYLIIVIGALVLEKVLLTSFGYVSFSILIPLACAILILFLISNKASLKVLGIKVAVLALILVNVVPLSMKVSDYIYDANKDTVNQVSDVEEYDEFSTAPTTQNDNQSWLSQKLNGVKEKVQTSTKSAVDTAKEVSSKFVDAVAILLLTTCVIPLLVVMIILWAVKFLFGNVIPIQLPPTKPFHKPFEHFFSGHDHKPELPHGDHNKHEHHHEPEQEFEPVSHVLDDC